MTNQPEAQDEGYEEFLAARRAEGQPASVLARRRPFTRWPKTAPQPVFQFSLRRLLGVMALTAITVWCWQFAGILVLPLACAAIGFVFKRGLWGWAIGSALTIGLLILGFFFFIRM